MRIKMKTKTAARMILFGGLAGCALGIYMLLSVKDMQKDLPSMLFLIVAGALLTLLGFIALKKEKKNRTTK